MVPEEIERYDFPDHTIALDSYVKLEWGPHAGLYGWVIDHMEESGHHYVAVSDKPRKSGGLYQWYRTTQVWVAIDDDEETAIFATARTQRKRWRKKKKPTA